MSGRLSPKPGETSSPSTRGNTREYITIDPENLRADTHVTPPSTLRRSSRQVTVPVMLGSALPSPFVPYASDTSVQAAVSGLAETGPPQAVTPRSAITPVRSQLRKRVVSREFDITSPEPRAQRITWVLRVF